MNFDTGIGYFTNACSRAPRNISIRMTYRLPAA